MPNAGTCCIRRKAAAELCGKTAGERAGHLRGGERLHALAAGNDPRWVPGGIYALGTDGFGRSESREALRRFFEVDAECIALAALTQLAKKGEIKPAVLKKAVEDLKIDPEKANPMRA